MMEHYTKEQWQQFRKEECSQDIYLKMEEHLTECDLCLSVFLELIDEQEIVAANNLLSPDFAKRVMKKVQGHKYSANKKKKWFNEKLKSMVVYYMAAASITLIFVGSGLFQNFVEKGTDAEIAKIGSKIINDKKLYYDISGEVANRASVWIQNFETQGRFNDEEK